jgi:hypothetical protein
MEIIKGDTGERAMLVFRTINVHECCHEQVASQWQHFHCRQRETTGVTEEAWGAYRREHIGEQSQLSMHRK